VIDVALLGIIRRWHLRDKVPLREIAKRLGISRNTVRRYLRSETTEPAYAERQTASAIDPYAHQLAGWLKTEAAKSRKQRRSLKQLHEELADLGFKGSYDRVAAFARQWREGQTEWVNSARKRTNNKKIKDKTVLVEEMRRVIRASLGNRAKEGLLVDFINQTDLDQIRDKASVIDAFFTFAQVEQQREAQELIGAENLNPFVLAASIQATPGR
jgi:transcriptional regulator with XRE-family HTH domain